MARKVSRPAATSEQVLSTLRRRCPGCGSTLWADYDNFRTVRTGRRITSVFVDHHQLQAGAV
jgi:ribosomal protein S27AE